MKKRAGADALLDVIEQLQGAPLPASILETEILAARLENYDPADLDAVVAAGEVVWVGIEPLGDRDGRLALYLTDHLPRLLPRRQEIRLAPVNSGKSEETSLSGREQAIVDHLTSHGASFFEAVHDAAGGGFPAETVDALWNLVWQGLITNDTVHALRAYTRARTTSRRRANREAPAFRSRRLVPPSAEGRWALVRPLEDDQSRPTRGTIAAKSKARRETTSWAAALAQQLLNRHGILTRESIAGEALAGGFGVVYAVLKAMEETGRIRRGYFVAGLGATQFAMPGALDLLRALRDSSEEPEVVMMAATDPANPYGATLKFPPVSSQEDTQAGRGPTRTVGATVILVDGGLAAYLSRGDRQLSIWYRRRSRSGRGPHAPWRGR